MASLPRRGRPILRRILRALSRGAAGLAALAVSAVATWALAPQLDASPNALLAIGVSLAGWFGGLAVGLFSAVVATWAGPWLLASAPVHPDALQPSFLRLALFCVLGVLTGGVVRSNRRQRELYESAMGSVGYGLVFADAKGRVVFVNSKAEALSGWSLAKARRRSLAKVVPLVDGVSGLSRGHDVDVLLGGGETRALPPATLLVTREGPPVPIEGSLGPWRDSEGDVRGVVFSFRDATARTGGGGRGGRLSTEMARSLERLGQIAANLPAIVWEAQGVPGHGVQRITYVSEHLEALTGYTVAEATSTPNFWLDHMHPDDKQQALADVANVASERDSSVTQYRWVAKDGRTLWLESLLFAVRDAAGEVVGLRGVAIDITERMGVEAERSDLLSRERQARRDAEEANRLKDEFLMTLSHELRTPLNAILGWAMLLRTRPLPPDKQRRALETIERNARAQTQLIEDLLDMSRIVTGKLRLETKPVNVELVIDAVVETMRPGAEAKGVRLEVIADPDVELVPGDGDRLQQVIWNLLSNAIKFTPSGGRVEVRLRQLYDRVLITVSDTGQGIAPGLLPYVFDRFRQGGATHGGLGLGLAIARHLVELHGGSIEAQSLGESMGASFIVRLPIYAVRPVRWAVERQRPPGDEVVPGVPADPLAGLRVLVVDATADSRELVQVMLEGAGARVTTASNYREALARLNEGMPDVLVSDPFTADSDGFLLIREIRRRELDGGAPHLPALSLSGFARAEDRRAALEAGFEAHLARPISTEQLTAALAEVVGR